jgi:hypothetical protein
MVVRENRWRVSWDGKQAQRVGREGGTDRREKWWYAYGPASGSRTMDEGQEEEVESWLMTTATEVALVRA